MVASKKNYSTTKKNQKQKQKTPFISIFLLVRLEKGDIFLSLKII